MKDSKKKILILSSRIPYPLIGGDRLRTFNFGKILKQRYQVDLAFINDTGINPGGALSEAFDNLIEFHYTSKLLTLNAIKGLFSTKPVQVLGNYFRSIQGWLDKMGNDYDLIICSNVRMAEYFEHTKLSRPFKLIDYVDAMSLNYGDSIEAASGFWRLFYTMEYKRLRNYERLISHKFNLGLITSIIDKEYLEKELGISLPLAVVPMGAQERLLKIQSGAENDNIVFFGKMDYYANEVAVEFFCKEIFPKIKKLYKNIEFLIVGANPTKKIFDLAKQDGVKVLGYIDDPYPIIAKAKLFVSPQLIGAGIQNKVLQAMALGKPVIGTKKALAAISGKEGIHYEAADSSDEMSAKICYLLEDEKKRKCLGENARKLISEQYTWRNIGGALLKIIGECLNDLSRP